MPVNSPRSVDTIIDSIRTTQEDVNPRADIRKGPLAGVVWSFCNELSRTEEFVGYLQDLHQFENAERIEEDDLYNLAANYGKDPNIGRSSRHQVFFYRYSRPEEGKSYPVDIGTTVSDREGRFNYLSINYGQMDGNYADLYYNANDKWYEIPVMVEAANVGSEYDLPPFSINRILSSLEDYDGCINREDVKRSGSDPVDPIQLIRNLQNTLQGIGTDLGGHIIDVLQDIDPTGYDDIAFVPSSDFERFKRNKSLQGRLGYDIYLITDLLEQHIQNGVARGGEFRIPLERGPVSAVEFVTVNGQPVPFIFNPETNPAIANSPEGTYEVYLTDPLLPLQSYQISFVYYEFCWQGNLAFQGRSTPYQTNVLVRLADPREVYIAGEAIVASTGDREQVLADLRGFTERWIRNPNSTDVSRRKFITLLDPTAYVENAIANVESLSDIKLTGFIRLDIARLPVEIISFDGATEYPFLSPNFDVR